MKNALILFRDENRDFEDELLKPIADIFKNSGYPLLYIDILSCGDEFAFKRRIEDIKRNADNLLIVCDDTAFDVKEDLKEIFELEYVEDLNARRFLDAVNLAKDSNFDSSFAQIPKGAKLVPNIDGAFQGYIVDDGKFSFAVLPKDKKELSLMLNKYFIPHLDEKYNQHNKRITLKYFGDKDKLLIVLKRAVDLSDGLKYYVNEKYGDIKVDILFPKKDSSESNESVRYIIRELKDNIYAEYDVSLSERLFDILKLKNLKLSVAESFTGGRLVSSIIKNSGASQVLHEGIVCYSNESKIDRLCVEKTDIEKEGAVSSIVAYQMATGLLRKGIDIAISTTGIAGPKSDDSLKPVGLCYIGIGMKDGVHTYKLNLNGDRENITETAKNTALFLAIKKLKNI